MILKNINSPTTSSMRYCDLREFSTSFRSVHGYLALMVCIFGSIANVLNICVLTTKEMRVPTNFILTGLAVSDLLVMFEYMPFSIHVIDPAAMLTPGYFTYAWAVYMHFHAVFAQVCHFISICLTVALAIWRFIAVALPHLNKTWCNPIRTKITIMLFYLFCPLICTPLFLGTVILKIPRQVYPNGTIIQEIDNDTYTGRRTDVTIYALGFNRSYENINFWMYGVVIKLLPCILLTFLLARIIKTLLDSKKRWKKLSNSSGIPLDRSHKDAEKNQQVDRTTKMLLAVLLLFLLTEFPQAVLGLISGVLGTEFYKHCYLPLGDLMDMMALTNSAINFVLYCSMSQQFREEFCNIFVQRIISKFTSIKSIVSMNSQTKITSL